MIHPSIWVAIIDAIPVVLGIVVLMVALVVYRREIRRMLPGVRTVAAFGVTLTLGDSAVAQWTAEANRRRTLRLSTGDLKAALDRADASRNVFAGTELLWVDDAPEQNVWERRALRSLGVRVTSALSNAEARELMRRNEYDLVISDIDRENGEDARGTWRSMPAHPDRAPVIYYVATLQQGTPEEAFGITNRPDVLLDLLTDALQRREFRLRQADAKR